MRKVLVTDTDLPSFEIEDQVLSPLGAEIHLASSADEKTLLMEASDSEAIIVDRARISDDVIAAAARGGSCLHV